MTEKLVPFPIVIDVTGDSAVIQEMGMKVHFYIGGPRTAESPEVNTHILCWAMTEKIPDYTDYQEYWYSTVVHSEVDCPVCLEWIHS